MNVRPRLSRPNQSQGPNPTALTLDSNRQLLVLALCILLSTLKYQEKPRNGTHAKNGFQWTELCITRATAPDMTFVPTGCRAK